MSQPNRIQPPNLFNQALSKFKLSLTPTEVNDFQFTSLQDVERTIVDIQRKQAATKTLRNINRLRPFITAMEQYGKVIEIFVNVSSFVAFVWVSETPVRASSAYWRLKLAVALKASLMPL
jgi:hypothetical protein